MPVDAWLGAAVQTIGLLEVVNGAFVVKRVGGNPHHYLAGRLAQEFERQWPEAVATAPGNWALEITPDGRVVLGRMPDVLVDGEAVLTESVFLGVPEAVVEVWSPSNTLAEMNDKRREYRAAGLPILVEAFLTEAGDVHLEWLVRREDRWVTAAVAVGTAPLTVRDPRQFTVVPNALLRRSDAS